MITKLFNKALGKSKTDLTPIANAPAVARLNAIRAECQALVKRTAFVSAGVAIIPVPFFDVVVDAGILTQVLPKISESFGLGEGRTSIYSPASKEIHWDAVKTLGFEFAGLVATRGMTRKALQGFGTKIVTKQVTKFIPLGGQLVAASMGYFAMKKIALAHLDECYQQALAKLA